MRFRPLCDDDLPMLHTWLNDPGVVPWWEGEDVSMVAVGRDYGSNNTEPVEYWIAVDDDIGDVGWIQCYAIASFLDHPDGDEARKWVEHGVPETAVGIDYLVGSSDLRGQGVGTTMIAEFVEQIVFGRHPVWDVVCASPTAANTASWRALARAGFERMATFPHGDVSCNLMVRHRAGAQPQVTR